MGKSLGALLIVAGLVLALYALNPGVDHIPGPTPPPAPLAPDRTGPDPVPVADRPGDGVPQPGTEAGNPAAASGPGRRVTGSVTDVARDAPIVGALVRVLSTGETTRTDAKGAFSFPAVRGKMETIRVEADGYPFASGYPDLVPGREPPPLVFRLRPGAVVAGVVLGPNGEGRPGASLRESSNPDRTFLSGAEGVFRVAGLRFGRGTVLEARAPGLVPAISEVLHLDSGEERTGLVLRLRPGATIAGTVRFMSGAPAEGARVYGIHAARTYRPVRATTDAGGRYKLSGLGMGNWTVQAAVKAGEQARVEVRDLGEGEARAEVDLWFGGVISGQVVDAGGAPVPRANLSAMPADGDGKDGRWVRTQADEEGRFSLTVRGGAKIWNLRVRWPDSLVELPPVATQLGERNAILRLPEPAAVSGRVVGPDGEPAREFAVLVYRKNASAPGLIEGTNGEFKARGLAPGKVSLVARTDGHWSEGKDVVLEPGRQSAEIRIELRKFGVLEVLVVDADGRGVAGVKVFYRRVPGTGSSSRGETDAEGALRLDRVRPGKYILTAVRTGRVAGVAHGAVTVVEGGTERVTLTLPD